MIIALPMTTLMISYYKRFVLNDEDEIQINNPEDLEPEETTM